jgi:ABC-type glycerol-3-phosphate transport system substrate-binding protein
MRGIGIVSLLVLAVACSGNSASTGAAPLTEYLCNGRDSNGDVTERVEATDRDAAIKKFKEKHTDIPVAACTPKPR